VQCRWLRRGEKGVNRVFRKCFFHCGEGRGLFFLQIDYGGEGSVETHRPTTDLTTKTRQRVHLDFILFYSFFTIEGEGGGGMEFYFSVQKEAHMKTKNKSGKIRQ